MVPKRNYVFEPKPSLHHSFLDQKVQKCQTIRSNDHNFLLILRQKMPMYAHNVLSMLKAKKSCISESSSFWLWRHLIYNGIGRLPMTLLKNWSSRRWVMASTFQRIPTKQLSIRQLRWRDSYQDQPPVIYRKGQHRSTVQGHFLWQLDERGKKLTTLINL